MLEAITNETNGQDRRRSQRSAQLENSVFSYRPDGQASLTIDPAWRDVRAARIPFRLREATLQLRKVSANCENQLKASEGGDFTVRGGQTNRQRPGRRFLEEEAPASTGIATTGVAKEILQAPHSAGKMDKILNVWPAPCARGFYGVLNSLRQRIRSLG